MVNGKDVELYQVDVEEGFQKEVRRFTRKKKFKTLPDQIEGLINQVINGEFEGKKLTHSDFPTPHDVYKLRLPNPDTNVGKSDGYRVIYMVLTETKIVVFLMIYYKKEQEAVSDSYMAALIDGYFLHVLNEDD